MIKRGISPLIATVLMIGFTVMLIIFVTNWTNTFIESAEKNVEESSSEQIKCSTDVNFEISCTCTGSDEGISSCSYKMANNEDSTLVKTTYRSYKADGAFIKSGEGPQDIGPFEVGSSTIAFAPVVETNIIKLEVLATEVRSGGKIVQCGNIAISNAECITN